MGDVMSQTTPDPEYPQSTRPTAGDDGGVYVPQPDPQDPAEGDTDVDEESQDGDERGESKRP